MYAKFITRQEVDLTCSGTFTFGYLTLKVRSILRYLSKLSTLLENEVSPGDSSWKWNSPAVHIQLLLELCTLFPLCAEEPLMDTYGSRKSRPLPESEEQG